MNIKHDPMDDILDRPIAFNPAFKRITGSTVAALMLSQAWYWSRRTKDPEGWFYKTGTDWEEETGLTRNEQDQARRLLRQFDFWEEKLKGIPATMYFRVDREILIAVLMGDITGINLTPEEIVSNSARVLSQLSKAGYMRAKKLGLAYEYVNYADIVIRDRAECHVCQRPIDRGPGQHEDAMHFDHVIPLDKGGRHESANIKCTHAYCNLSKHNQIVSPKQTSSFRHANQDGHDKTSYIKEAETTSEITTSPLGEYLKLFAFTPSPMDQETLNDLQAKYPSDRIVACIQEIHHRGISSIKYAAKMLAGGWPENKQFGGVSPEFDAARLAALSEAVNG